MTEQIEAVIKVSPKGQIVIPREIRKKLGLKGGEKLLVLTRDGDILLRKAQEYVHGGHRLRKLERQCEKSH